MESSYGYYQDIELTQEMAEFIKELRTKQDYTWRAVDREFQMKYLPKEKWWFNKAILRSDPSMERPHGHQIGGMALCEAAMNFFGEKTEDGWN